MYHPRFNGSHYQMGYRFGRLMNKNNIHVIQVDGLPDERAEFGNKCVAACNEVYPEVIEEIRGLADGWGVPFRKLAGWLLTIYCYEYKRGCTCFAFRDRYNVIFGRNSDFFTEIRDVCQSALYLPDKGYWFTGNSTAMVQMEDGCNEHGLAIGLTFIPPGIIRPGMNAGILLRYILERCGTVDEAITALYSLPVASAQTFTMIDRTGGMAVVECNCEQVIVIKPRDNENFLVSTNQFISPEMKQYEILCFIDSRERYRVATEALKTHKDSYSLKLAQDILAGKYGFMCQYDRKLHFDTLWSTVYDLKNDRILCAEGNPSKAEFKEDNRLSIAKQRRPKGTKSRT